MTVNSVVVLMSLLCVGAAAGAPPSGWPLALELEINYTGTTVFPAFRNWVVWNDDGYYEGRTVSARDDGLTATPGDDVLSVELCNFNTLTVWDFDLAGGGPLQEWSGTYYGGSSGVYARVVDVDWGYWRDLQASYEPFCYGFGTSILYWFTCCMARWFLGIGRDLQRGFL